MLKDITLGQFFPGDTPVHRLDPRSKILLLIVFIVALFMAHGWAGYGLMLLVTALCMAVSRISPRNIFKGLKPMLFIIVFTAALNLFYTQGTPLFPGWPITREGLERSLTDGMERLLSPLKKIGLPVHEITMMMSMALRFIPTLIEETDKIMSAQKARGADFENGNLLQRAKALLPILVPLFVSSFRRADELAVAMESRCYHGGSGRTRMKQLHFQALDLWALALGALLLAAMILLRRFGL